MGSSSFRSLDTGAFHLAEAWFPPHELLSRHTHDRASVAIMLDGSFDLEVPGRVHHCPPTATFVEPAGEVHANRMGRRGARVVVVQPDPAATDLLRPFAQVLDRVSHRHHAGLAEQAERLAREMRQADDLVPLAAEAATLELLVSLARLDREERQGPPPWPPRTGGGARAIRRAASGGGAGARGRCPSRAPGAGVPATLSDDAGVLRAPTAPRLGGTCPGGVGHAARHAGARRGVRRSEPFYPRVQAPHRAHAKRVSPLDMAAGAV
jgi:hypothetical protein